jgi:hypothetical protein
MVSLTRFSRLLFVATVAVGASLGITNCGPDYSIYSVHVTAAKPTNNLATCKITITDQGGVPVVNKLPLGQQSGGIDTLRQGCGGALTPTSGNIGTFSYSTSRSGGTLNFLVEGYDDSNKIVQSGRADGVNVVPYPPEIKVEVTMAMTTP